MSIKWGAGAAQWLGERPEQKGTVKFDAHEKTRTYWVSGATDGAGGMIAAINAVGVNTPAIDQIEDLNGNVINLFRNKMDPKETGGGCWEVTVTYANTPDEFKLTINNGVQSTKATQALETIEVYDCIDGSTATGFDPIATGTGEQGTTNVPYFLNAIGVSGVGANRNVEGVDVEIGKFDFSISKKTKSAQLSAAYLGYLAGITPSVNDAIWTWVWQTQVFAFPKGSVKFRGARVVQNSDTDFEIVHDFNYEPPLVDMSADAWVSGTTYNQNDQVTYGGHTWISCQAAPQSGNTPTTYAEWNAETVYANGAAVAEGDFVWTSTVDDNQNNDPALDDGSHWVATGTIYWIDAEVTTPGTVIGNSATIEREGQQYTWIYYEPRVNNGTTVQTPVGVVVQQVYKYADFTRFQCF